MLRRVWVPISGAFAAVSGLLPHILHHAGPLAGAALFAGVGGSLLFGALGLLAAIPLLLRLRKRFGSWRAPAIALLLFAAMFSISTFVIGPAISGEDDTESSEQPKAPRKQSKKDPSHQEHHKRGTTTRKQ